MKTPLNSFFGFFIRSFRVTILLIVGLGLLGTAAIITLPRESAPEIDIPVAVVVTAYPGASARDVEELVTNEIEEGIKNLEGISEYTSTSQLGISSVTIEFAADEDIEDATRRLREAVDSIRDLPADAEDPEVVEISFSNEPIISIGIGGIADERLLRTYAEDVAEEIRDVTGVNTVSVVGGKEEEIKVTLNPTKLDLLNLNITQVVGAIRVANTTAPFGQLETDEFVYDLRLVGTFNTVGDVAQIAIPLADGTVTTLGAIATVELALEDTTNQARISPDNNVSTAAVTLQVYKEPEGNIVQIVDAVEARITELEADILPSELTIETFADRAQDIRTQLRNVTQSGVQTVIVVFIILWLFLGWQEALIASLSIPLTFFISFLIFEPTNTTLNGISLFSLILALGLLVDNSIVIVEGIHEERDRPNLAERAAEVVQKFQKPLIGGTLTTVAAFFPMLLVSGIIGQFLRTIPIVVSATLISSLFVALALIPTVAVLTLKRFKVGGNNPWVENKLQRFQAQYQGFLHTMLHNRRYQNRFIVTLVVLLVIGLSLPFTGLLKTALFPSVDIDFMIINVERTPGTRLQVTAETVGEIESIVQTIPEVTSYSANIGSATSLDLGGGSSSEHLASFFINLDSNRDRSSFAITEELREKFATVPQATITIAEISAGPPAAPPVEIKVIGNDLDVLDQLSQEVMAELDNIPGTIDIDRDLRHSAGEFIFTLNREELAAQGLTATEVANTLRVAIFGAEATTFLNSEGDEVQVQLSADDTTVDSIDKITSVSIATPNGQSVPLKQLVTVELSSSVNTIRHRSGERTVTVTANTNDTITPNEVSASITERLEAKEFPDGYEFQIGGEQEETAETFAELYRSMVIAVILILIILVVEFDSYRQPFLIFLSIPLALIGVLFGLLITGSALNFATFIGLVSLTGIVVNDAIILVDRMNQKNTATTDTREAVAAAANSRFRPVILTTLTTVGGVAPLIFVDEFFRDMAITVITGLTFASILTLVLIPILYIRQQQKLGPT